MVGGGLGALWSHDDVAAPWPQATERQAYATPGVTYFVRDGIGVGLTLGGLFGGQQGRGSGASYDVREYETSVGLGGVFELPLGPRTGLLAIVRVSYVREWRRLKDFHNEAGYLNVNAQGRTLQTQTALANPGANVNYDAHVLRPSLFVPVVFHVSPSVALGFGPELWVDWLLASTWKGVADWGPSSRYSLGASSWIGVSF